MTSSTAMLGMFLLRAKNMMEKELHEFGKVKELKKFRKLTKPKEIFTFIARWFDDDTAFLWAMFTLATDLSEDDILTEDYYKES